MKDEKGIERHCREKLFGPFRPMGETEISRGEGKKDKDQLRDSQRMFDTLMDNVPGMVYRCRNDRDWTMEFVSSKCLALTGYTPSELIGNSTVAYGQLIYPEDRQYVWEEVQAALRERRSFKLNYRITSADGSIKWVWEQGCGIFSPAGELLFLEGFITDITEYKKTEEENVKQKTILEALNRVFRETLWCETEEEIARVCLSVAEELTGSTFGFVGEINDEGRFDTIALSDPGWNECKMQKLKAAKLIKNMEIRGIWGTVLKDKQSLIVNDPASCPELAGLPKEHPSLVSFLGVPLKYMGDTVGMIALANKPQGYTVFDQQAVETLSMAFVEVLNRKRARDELIKVKNHLEKVIEGSLDCIVVADAKGFISRVNKSLLELINCQEKEVLGRHFTELFPSREGVYQSSMGELIKIDTGFCNEMADVIKRLDEEGRILNWDSYLVSGKGMLIPVEQNITYLYSENGEAVGLVSVIRDITGRRNIERERKTAEERLYKLVELANAGIIAAEIKEGREQITQVNERAEEFYGYSRGELLGQSPHILTPEKYRNQHWEVLREFLETGNLKKTLFEEEGMRKDGSLFPIEIAFSLSKTEEDTIIVVAVVRDISERKKTEAALRESEERYRLLAEHIPLHLGAIDESGHFMLWNKYSEKMLGYTAEEAIGKMCPRDIHESEEEAEEVIRIASTSGIFDKDVNLVHKDRRLVPAHLVVVPKRDENGGISGFYGFAEDVSARKTAEEVLRKSEERYHKLIELASDAIISANRNGDVVSFNKKAEDMFGYTQEEMLGKSVLLLSPPEERVRQEKLFQKFKMTDELYIIGKTMEGKGLRKDGRIFPFEGTSFVIETEGDKVLTVILRDITERKEMEEKLLQSEKLKSLGELAGGVAHDFNNVLAAILGRVQLLRLQIEAQGGKQERRMSVSNLVRGLTIIEEAARDGAETVRRIQEFSRRRVDDSVFTTINVNELVNHALEFTRARWKDEAEAKGIKIVVKKELSNLPPTRGSKSELREVLTNLIHNALDAMPQGGCLTVKTFQENNGIWIKVEDTGVGIPASMKDRIFDPFFTTKGPQSTGLGLSVSYGIINRHQGTITVDTAEGVGTTFSIRLPVLEGHDTREQLTNETFLQKKARILVIEDEEGVQSVLKDILTDAGHEVEIVSDGLKGIELLEEKEFDLVFTDLGMPGMSGWEVAEKVKSRNERIPVVLITGWNIDLKEAEKQGNGVDRIIQKPFELKQVLQVVQEGMMLRDGYAMEY